MPFLTGELCPSRAPSSSRIPGFPSSEALQSSSIHLSEHGCWEELIDSLHGRRSSFIASSPENT